MKLPIKGNKNVLLYAAAGALTIMLAAYFLFSNLSARIKNMGRQVRLAEAQFRKAVEIEKGKETFTEEHKRYQPFLETLKWDERKLREELLKEVENMAKEAAVVVVNLTPQDEVVKTKKYSAHKVDLRIEADFQRFLKFLNKIQDSRLLIRVERLALTPKGEEGVLFKAEITIAFAVPV